jgi:hypothetical protein
VLPGFVLPVRAWFNEAGRQPERESDFLPRRSDDMKRIAPILLAVVAAAGFAIHAPAAKSEGTKADGRVFELRTYYAADGKMEELKAQFRDHVNKIFAKHGITIVGFWTPTKPDEAQKKLIYLLAFPTEAAAQQSWKAFKADPEWTATRKESEKNGALVEQVESVFLNPTEFSPLK